MKALLRELGPRGELDVQWSLREFGLGAKDAVPALSALAQHKDAWVRSAALETLKKIDPKGSIK